LVCFLENPDDFKRELGLAAGGDMKTGILFFDQIWLCIGLVAALGVVCGMQAQGGGPKFIVDPSWPRPLPQNWANGQVSGVCVDAQDNVFIVNRNDITDKEAEIAQQAPPFIEFDLDGNVVNSFETGKSFQISPTAASSTMRTIFGRPAMAMESSKNTVTTENY
jgi:hypothetical protein